MAFDATADEQSTWQLEPFFWSNGASLTKVAQQTDTSDHPIDALVGARLDRQAIFDWAEPPEVTVVQDEGCCTG